MKNMLKLVAFDCFGTVFCMDPIDKGEIFDYVSHVKADDFSPYEFPESWRQIKAHADSKEGIDRLRAKGLMCVALSNGPLDLISEISDKNGIVFDHIIDLVEYRVYKPHIEAYKTVEKETGFLPAECLMVTANPTFGDIEGSAAIGMPSRVIRRRGCPQTIIELSELINAITPQKD